MKRQGMWFSLILIALLAGIYLPQMLKPGGIRFGLIQDITGVYGFYPWDTFTTREIRAGNFPLWNPHNALGEPHIANMQSAVFYPLTAIKVLTNMNGVALDVILVARLFLAGLFMFWFLGDLGVKFPGRVFGAASFATTGYFTRYVYMSHLNVEIMIPLILFCFGRLAAEPRRKWFFASAISVWLSIVGGFPEATLYALLFGIIWYFFSVRANMLRAAPILFGAIAFGCILSLPQLLPFIEYMANAWNYHPQGIGAAHLNVKYAFTLIMPWFFGENDVSPLVPFLTPYVGTAPFLFAIMGITRNRRGAIFFLVSAIIIFALIHGIQPFILIGKIYPFSVTLNYKYAAPVFAFCVSALAGIGVDRIAENDKRTATVAFIVCVVIIFGAYVGYMAKFFAPYNMLGPRSWIWLNIAVLCIAAIMALKRGGAVRFVAWILLIATLVIPALGNRPTYNDDIDKAESSKAKEFFATHDNARFAVEAKALFPDLNLLWNLNDIRYYNPIYLKSYVRAFADANGLKTPDEIARNFLDHALLQPDRDALNDPRWSKMGLGYWIGGQPGSLSLMRDLMIKADWTTETRGMIGRSTANENDDLPALFAHAPAKIAMAMAISSERPSLMITPSLDPRSRGKSDGVAFTIVVSTENENRTVYSKILMPESIPVKTNIDLSLWAGRMVNLVIMTTPGPSGDATSDWSVWGDPSLVGNDAGGWINVGSNIYRRPVDMIYADGDSIITSAAYYPGWRAFSEEGKEVKITPASGAFQSVNASKAKFVYHPVSFDIGLWSFLVSALFMLSAIIIGRSINGKPVV